jgi:choline dehydrogenase
MFDYVIVGAGSAGCALANRLSEAADARVLLLEAGPSDRSLYIRMPVGFYKLTGSRLTWGYQTVPQRHANNRSIAFSQGKVLGGSSSINGMVYTRGNRVDYDRWAQHEGCAGWSYANVLPYFKRAEDNNRYLNEYHGEGGPLGVSDPRFTHPLSRLFIKAAQQRGIPFNADVNGAVQDGCCLYQTNTRNGRRSSSASAYLAQAGARPNLHIQTGSNVLKLLIEAGHAVGVEYVARGRVVRVNATREVILCAGAVGSPRLLMLSGIGPATHLRSVGVDVQVDLPGVGRNLQDHIDVDTVYRLKGVPSLDVYKRLRMRLWAAMEYFLFGGGPVASNVVEAGAFWRSAHSVGPPDLQLHFLPGAGVEESTPGLSGGSGCTLNSYFLRPQSRGSITLQTADPRAAPLIDPHYWEQPSDLERSLDGLMLCREIMDQPVFRQHIDKEQLPGPHVRTRGELVEFLRAFGRTAYHPVGTCKMGSDEMAVVDTELRVRGVEKLRVVDASVIPSIVGSNTNAATIMIAERASDLIRNRIPVPSTLRPGLEDYV